MLDGHEPWKNEEFGGEMSIFEQTKKNKDQLLGIARRSIGQSDSLSKLEQAEVISMLDAMLCYDQADRTLNKLLSSRSTSQYV